MGVISMIKQIKKKWLYGFSLMLVVFVIIGCDALIADANKVIEDVNTGTGTGGTGTGDGGTGTGTGGTGTGDGGTNPLKTINIIDTQPVFSGDNYETIDNNQILIAHSQKPLELKEVDTKAVLFNFTPNTFKGLEISLPNVAKSGLIDINPFEKHVLDISYSQDLALTIPQDKNPVMEKINKILTNFSWTLHNFDAGAAEPDKNNWANGITVEQAKAFYTMNYNMAYFVSQPVFEDIIVNNSITKDKSVTFLSTAEKEQIIPTMRAETKTLKIGITVTVGGLGGGDVLGVANHVLDTHAYNLVKWQDNKWTGGDIWFHEFSHVFGYTHDSNMTYKQPDNGDKTFPNLPKIVQAEQAKKLTANDIPFPPSAK